jgi:hypothetical protein
MNDAMNNCLDHYEFFPFKKNIYAYSYHAESVKNISSQIHFATMKRYQRGVHFGAVSLKKTEQCGKFTNANFCLTFFTLSCNIMEP